MAFRVWLKDTRCFIEKITLGLDLSNSHFPIYVMVSWDNEKLCMATREQLAKRIKKYIPKLVIFFGLTFVSDIAG